MRNPTHAALAAAGGLMLLATGCAPLHSGPGHATRSATHAYDPYHEARDPYLHHWHRTSHTHFARHRFLSRHGLHHKGFRAHRAGCRY